MHPQNDENLTRSDVYPETSGPAYGLELVLQSNKFRSSAQDYKRSTDTSPTFKARF